MRYTADPEDPAFCSRVAAFLGQARVQHTVLMIFIVNAMQNFTESEHKANETLVETAAQPVERALHPAVQSLRQKIHEPRGSPVPVLRSATQPPFPFS